MENGFAMKRLTSSLQHLSGFGFFRSHRFPAAVLSLALITLAPLASAQLLYHLSISGEATVDDEMTVFGQVLTKPFTLQMLYDPALNTNTHVFPEGEQIAGNDFAGHNFYGYSASGVLNLDFTFGDDPAWATEISLSGDDLSDRFVAAGVSAAMWMDTDITQSTPGLINMQINFDHPDENEGSIGIGVTEANFDTAEGIWIISIVNEVDMEDEITGGEAVGSWSNIEMTVIPEPATFALVFSGLIAVFVALRRRRTA